MGEGEAYKGGKRDESKKRGIQNAANNKNGKNKNAPGSGGSQYNEH